MNAVPPFLGYENADNARGRWNTTGVVLLGTTESANACQAECVKTLGKDPTSGCTAYTWYHVGHNLAKSCYGDSTGSWRPFYSDLSQPTKWGNVTSAQNMPSAYQTPCSTRADCSYNGKCVDGKCACYPQWMGKHCGQLNLIPTSRDAGLQQHDARGRVSSWGGSVVRGDDGRYHMWAAEMTNDCGIVVWLSNSRIRHAVSTTGPTGPYLPHDISEGLWGHEPTVARAPTGEYALFWTAHFGKENVPCSRTPCDDCRDGETTIGRSATCLPDTRCTYRPQLLSYMAFAPDPAGPWSTPQPIPSPPGFAGDTNLAPIIRADGSLLALGRPPWVWRANDWRNASTYTVEKVGGSGTVEGEDPFLYVDSRDPSVLHGLSHAGGWDSSGGHVWSIDDGRTWGRHEDVAAYGSLITFTDDEKTAHAATPDHLSLSRRERPHLVFDGDGLPVALTNGATERWPCTHPEHCPRDHCFTALQRLNTGSLED